MFSINDITELDIESINNCNAQCPLCLRGQVMKTNNILDWDRLTTQVPGSVWQNLKTINFNGNTGDNILHPRIEHMLLWACDNTNAMVYLNTNGGVRNCDWWYNLGQKLHNKKHSVIFAIDGLEHTHEIYRVGTNWQKVIDNASAFISGGGRAEWQFILFKHNQHQVDQAKKLSKALGFDKFFVVDQDRFDRSGKLSTESTIIERHDRNLSELSVPVKKFDICQDLTQRIIKSDNHIRCRSQRIGWIAFYADGTVWPCCYLMGWHLASHQKPFQLINYHFRKKLGLDTDAINIYNHTLQHIVESELWQKRFPESFVDQPNPICLQQCSGTKK